MAAYGPARTLVKVRPDRLPQAFGTVLRKLREGRGLSQEELAHRAKTAQSYLSLLEAGRRSPSLVTLGLVAEALQMKLSHLVKLVEREATLRP